jgi:hypothetical protein
VEVSDTTLANDRKMVLTYAATGVPVYWIVNLVERQVEVYTSPAADGYGVRLDYLPGQEVPVILDGTVVDHIRVSEILPFPVAQERADDQPLTSEKVPFARRSRCGATPHLFTQLHFT